MTVYLKQSTLHKMKNQSIKCELCPILIGKWVFIIMKDYKYEEPLINGGLIYEGLKVAKYLGR